MSVEWDRQKATANLQKHGVDFADAATVLEDDAAATVRELLTGDEDRYLTLGMDALGRLLVVVYTWRGDSVRLISARPASARERRQYGDRT
ncbi:MAG: BrnT family toxin [Acidobacteria bacterium]|nr:BrnT family toxin [Acidobacteriota bacterium]